MPFCTALSGLFPKVFFRIKARIENSSEGDVPENDPRYRALASLEALLCLLPLE
jgi:hypothetical protein